MFSITIQPRVGEVDFLGHINNTVLACWFELARNPLFEIFEPEIASSRMSWPLIMAHAEYDYLHQIYFQPDVEVRTSIDRIGVKSFTVYHEVWQEGALCATGKTVIVYYDFAAGKSAAIPEDKRRLLAEHLGPAPSSRMAV
jgi:acyl-CoA thioester hydrolase